MKSSLDYTNEVMDEFDKTLDTPVKDFFTGKVVLLTGGTGFLGQLYVQKLLRLGARSIYLVIRNKQGKTSQQRLEELFTGVVFSKLKKSDPKYLSRIKIIDGDMEQLRLGISEKDLEDVFNNVQIVIHAAADVRFDQQLAKLVYTNIRGTREILKISENIKNLEVFAHISTAYSHCPRSSIDEKFYDPLVDPETLIQFTEKYQDTKEFEILQERIIKPWPNSYTFSKSLAEELVRQWSHKLPSVCVIRPSIIIATNDDPISGWCNNVYGVNGILVACGLGILRLMPFGSNLIGDIICADFVINSSLIVIWSTYKDNVKQRIIHVEDQNNDPKVYHVCSGNDHPVSWGEIKGEMAQVFHKYPSTKGYWKSTNNNTACPFMERVLTFYYHILPALFIDCYLFATKNTARTMPVYRKLQKYLGALKYFMRRQWKFNNSNMRSVIERLTPNDRELFPCDLKLWNWKDFSYNYNHGLKLYIALDSINNVEKARKKYKKLIIAHYLVLALFYSSHILIFYFILSHYGILSSIRSFVRPMLTYAIDYYY